MTAGKKAAAVSAERRSTYLFRVLGVFIIGAVRVINDNIVEPGSKVCRRPVPIDRDLHASAAGASRRRARASEKKPGGNQMSAETIIICCQSKIVSS